MKTLIKVGLLVITLSSSAMAWSPREHGRDIDRGRSDPIVAPELDADSIAIGVAILAGLYVLFHRN